MNKHSTFKTLEEKISVENIKYKNIPIWPYLRIYYGMDYLTSRKGKSASPQVVMSLAKNFFYGFFNIFKSYEYLSFTVAEQRKLIKKLYFDRSDFLFKYFKKLCIIEQPIPSNHYKKDQIPSENILSKSVLYLLEKIIIKLKFKNNIENEELLLKIEDELGININYNYYAKRFYAQYLIMKWLIYINNLKAVFFVVPYINMGYVYALKSKGIKVIEFQHGVINEKHIAYNPVKIISKKFYPDYLLTYGESEYNLIKQNKLKHVINPKSIGHFYLDYILNEYTIDNGFAELKQQFKKTIAVTLQGKNENEVISFIAKIANIQKDWLFILIPRNKSNNYSTTENIKLLNHLNCYQIIRFSDLHTTVSSTCCLESLSLNIKNILFDYNGSSKRYFGHLEDNNSLFITNSIDDYIFFVQNKSKPSKFPKLIDAKYKENLDWFINNSL